MKFCECLRRCRQARIVNDTGYSEESTTFTDRWSARAQSDCSSGFADALTTVRSQQRAVTVTATHQGLPVSVKIAEVKCGAT